MLVNTKPRPLPRFLPVFPPGACALNAHFYHRLVYYGVRGHIRHTLLAVAIHQELRYNLR